MKRKHLVTKTLALVLSAALCVGGTGIQTYASSVELSQSETEEVQTGESELPADTVSANDTDATASDGKTATDSEEITDTEETDADAETDAEETEITATEEDLDVDEARQMPLDSALVSNVCKDKKLAAAIIKIYNDANDTSYTDKNFTIGLLKAYEGVLDFTLLDESYKVDEIQDVTGLGCARKVKEIDISTTKATQIASYEFSSCENLTSIKLPMTISFVGDHAFVSCSSLTEVTLPDDLRTIGAYAFNKCENLAEINAETADGTTIEDTLPSGLQRIDTNAFDTCTKLTKISIPSYQNGAILQNATSLFANCTSLEEVTVGNTITIIPSSAFKGSGCTAGMVVTFVDGSSLDKIMKSAFEDASMSSMDLSMCTKLTAIEDNAFACGTSKNPLTEIKMPTEVKKEDGTALQLQIGKEAFYKTPLTSMYTGTAADSVVTLPDYVIKVGVAAFKDNTAMTELVLSSNLQEISDFTFSDCTSLAKVTQNTNNNECAVKSIGTCAFRKTGFADASFLGNMNHLIRIGGEEQHLDIMENRTEKNYNTIKEPDYTRNYVNKKEKLGSEVFTGSAIETVVLPVSLEVVESRAFYKCENLQSVTFNSGSKDKDKTRKIESEAFRQCGNLKTVILPENKKLGEKLEIEKGAFLKCEALDTLAPLANGAQYNGTFPVTLSKLGDNAFDDSGLKEVTIQDREDKKMPEIGSYVFRNSSLLRKVRMPEATTKLERGLFYECGVNDFATLGTNKNLQEIDDFALFGNLFTVLDLSEYTKLGRIGNSALAYIDLEGTNSYESENAASGLQTLVLPADVKSGKMIWGSYMLRGAISLDTIMVKKEYEKDGIACIPDYVANKDCAEGVFALTAVREAHWQYTDTKVNPWTYIPASMFNATAVQDISKCLLPKEDLQMIQSQAFLGCMGLETLDLSLYDKLINMGDGVFAECFYTKNVILPQNLKKLPEYTFFVGRFNQITSAPQYFSSLEYVDLANVTDIGKYCFASTNLLTDKAENKGGSGTSTGVIWPTTLKGIDCSNVTVVGEGAFYGNTNLATVKFGEKLTEIGTKAFQSCASLKMKENTITNVIRPASGSNGEKIVEIKTAGLPDSLEKIGDYAFYRCESLNEVKFGSKLQSVGKYAFAETIGHYNYWNEQNKPVVPSNQTYDYTMLTDEESNDLGLLNARFYTSDKFDNAW